MRFLPPIFPFSPRLREWGSGNGEVSRSKIRKIFNILRGSRSFFRGFLLAVFDVFDIFEMVRVRELAAFLLGGKGAK